MLYFSRWKTILILAVCVLGFIYSAPNMLGEHKPAWLPGQTVSLGLDLQGGSHLLLQVDTDAAIKARAGDLVQALRPDLRKEKIGYTRIAPLEAGVRLQLRDPAHTDQAVKLMRTLDEGLDVNTDKEDSTVIEGRLTEVALKQIQDRTVEQSIEIVRRRIDETGTREPIIQRQGADRIIVQLPGVENPGRIRDILGKTAQLAFHLVEESGGRSLKMAEDPTQTLGVARRPMITGDMLTNAQPSFDQFGNPVVSFTLNGIGARRFCDVTREHTNEPFAIVLDNEVIQAPNINEPICGGQAQISGRYTVQETNDLALLLRAGALPAPLKVMEERTVGPSLGADSVEAGKTASLVALALVLVFMALTYGLFGVLADLALVVNVALILALLSTLQATLTLPGIAGIVLTVGMAVDASVLIFERIREETRLGRSAMAAVEAGYKRAMGTIIDSNLTTLIAAIILYSYGTGPIRGFAVTLAIGIVTSFFCAVWVTRFLVAAWIHRAKPAELPV